MIDDPPPRRDAEEFAEAVSPAHDHIGLPATATGRLAARADRGRRYPDQHSPSGSYRHADLDEATSNAKIDEG